MFYPKCLKPLLLLTAMIIPFGVAATGTATSATASTEVRTMVNQRAENDAPHPLQIAQTELDELFEDLEEEGQSTPFPAEEPRPTFSDLEGDSWETESVYSLLARYNCLAGFPDGTFRGEEELTRYQFAAGINACLIRLDTLLQARMDGLVTKEDLALLFRALSAIFEQPAVDPDGTNPELFLPLPLERNEEQAEE